jgi:hypothetical protein
MNHFKLFLLSATLMHLLFSLAPQAFSYQKNTLDKLTPASLSPFLKASIYGNKKKLDKPIKKAFKDTGTLHLLTPSGLHLSSLLFLPKMLFKKWIPFIFIALILLIPFYHLPLYSLFRVSLFALIKTFSKTLPNKSIFLLVFLIDLIVGQFDRSPMSWLYSYSFWGLFIFKKNGKDWLIGYLTLYSILSITTHTPFYPMSFITNLFLTSLFTLLFPMFLVFQYFDFIQPLVNFFVDTTLYTHSLLVHTPKFNGSEVLITLVVHRSKRLLVILLLLTSTQTSSGHKLKNLGSYYLKRPSKPMLLRKEKMKLKLRLGGYCKFNLSGELGIERCRG